MKKSNLLTGLSWRYYLKIPSPNNWAHAKYRADWSQSEQNQESIKKPLWLCIGKPKFIPGGGGGGNSKCVKSWVIVCW